jgi:nicotinate dehydrogenase subunit A
VKQILQVNGQQCEVDVDPDTPLLFVLTDELHLNSPRFGCGMAQCGACTVMAGSQVIRSCVKRVSSVGTVPITTLEGLGAPEQMHPIQRAFLDAGAAQCGYCLGGIILTAKALLDGKPNATDKEIREALGGILCRCFAHKRMLDAIRRYRDRKLP